MIPDPDKSVKQLPPTSLGPGEGDRDADAVAGI